MTLAEEFRSRNFSEYPPRAGVAAMSISPIRLSVLLTVRLSRHLRSMVSTLIRVARRPDDLQSISNIAVDVVVVV